MRLTYIPWNAVSVIIIAFLLIGCAGPTQPPSADAPDWTKHVTIDLMPFWTMRSALGKTEADPFPTWRCNDGTTYGDRGCDFTMITQVNEEARASNQTGPLEWLSGPKNELFNRQYIRMHSRQTYAYGVAYHLTGDSEYLKLAHRGVKWLLNNAIDIENGGSYTYIENGKAKPSFKLRTSQDQSYTLLGLAFYYYLTRDPELLMVITKLKDDILKMYRSKTWENGELIKWMLENNIDDDPDSLCKISEPDRGTTRQKELVALLDQVNAYMLLMAQTAPAEERSIWVADTHSLAKAIWKRFYNKKNREEPGISPSVPEGMFAGCLTYGGPPPEGSACPIDPENCDPSRRHTDFGHSIKSFWMLDLVGREANNPDMIKDSEEGAKELLEEAYDKDGRWKSEVWWQYAELDQMAATLALADPDTWVPRLQKTYKYWLDHFVPGHNEGVERGRDDYEVVHWYDPACSPNCTNDLIPKAHLWKNAFHSMEHALVAYITTLGIDGTPATLYYALATDEWPDLQPYYYQAKVHPVSEGKIEDDGVTYEKVRAEFSEIRLRDPARDVD